MAWMHQNAVCDPQIPLEEKKHKFIVTCLGELFRETAPGSPEHEK
jgi:hypothetical protein